jgi:hypothetical protein
MSPVLSIPLIVTIGSIYKGEYAKARNKGKRLGSNFVPGPKILECSLVLPIVQADVIFEVGEGYHLPKGGHRVSSRLIPNARGDCK